MKVLFICNQNENRSKTAEEIFKDRFETKSAGLYNERPVDEKQLSWAELVVVMEDAQRTEISRRFPKRKCNGSFPRWSKKPMPMRISDSPHLKKAV